MQNNREVVVTGMGTLLSLGDSVNLSWNNLLGGKSSISRIESFDTSNIQVKIGGEIKDFKLPTDLIPEVDQRKYDRFIHYALKASDEAIRDSSILQSKIDRSKIATIIGVGMGGMSTIEEQSSKFINGGHRRVSPFLVPSTISNMAAGMVSIRFGFTGPSYSISSACTSSLHAITLSASEIMLGRADIAITGGSEAGLTPLSLSGFYNMKALTRQNDLVEMASRPFHRERDGFVASDGASILVLEELQHARRRGAKIYAKVAGIGMSSDAFHITHPSEDGLGAIKCMELAIQSANVKPKDVSYINAHATGTPAGDSVESKAINYLFRECNKKPFVSSTKSSTGHLLGAAGAVESIWCIKALTDNILPATINLNDIDPECDLNHIANSPIEMDIEYALNNSFGFGGMNCSILFQKYKG